MRTLAPVRKSGEFGHVAVPQEGKGHCCDMCAVFKQANAAFSYLNLVLLARLWPVRDKERESSARRTEQAVWDCNCDGGMCKPKCLHGRDGSVWMIPAKRKVNPTRWQMLQILLLRNNALQSFNSPIYPFFLPSTCSQRFTTKHL